MLIGMSFVDLRSEEGDVISFPKEIQEYSQFVKNMIDDCGFEDEESSIPINNIKTRTLEKIKIWVEHRRETAQPVDKDYDLPEWEDHFLEPDQAVLLEIVLAADFLQIQELVDITCKKVYSMSKGKSPAEVRDILKIENDLTKEEEEQIRKENEWIEEKV